MLLSVGLDLSYRMFSSFVHYSECRGKRKEPPAWPPQRKRRLPSNIFVRHLRTLISHLCGYEIQYYEVVILLMMKKNL